MPPHHPRQLRRAARQFASQLRGEGCPTDRAFDRFLPERLQRVSPEFWPPLVAARRAAEWFQDAGVRSVVDIGSGAGKFCVAGAFARLRFTGLEQRPFLIKSARGLARLFDVNDRVQFVLGSLGDVPSLSADAPTTSSTRSVTIPSVSILGAERDCAAVPGAYARDVAAAEQLRPLRAGSGPACSR